MSNGKPNIYDVYSRLGNIEGKLDDALKVSKDHQDRIQTLEKTTDQFVGKISIISTIAGFIGAGILGVINQFWKR